MGDGDDPPPSAEPVTAPTAPVAATPAATTAVTEETASAAVATEFAGVDGWARAGESKLSLEPSSSGESVAAVSTSWVESVSAPTAVVVVSSASVVSATVVVTSLVVVMATVVLVVVLVEVLVVVEELLLVVVMFGPGWVREPPPILIDQQPLVLLRQSFCRSGRPWPNTKRTTNC